MIQSSFLQIKWLWLIFCKSGQHSRMHVRLNLHPEFGKRHGLKGFHSVKYRNFTSFPCVQILWKGSFHIVSGNSLETIRKLYFPTKFSYQGIRGNCDVFRSIHSTTKIWAWVNFLQPNQRVSRIMNDFIHIKVLQTIGLWF